MAENEVSLMSYDVPKMVNDQGGRLEFYAQICKYKMKEGINYMK
jgi:hypothetical protein